MRHRKIQLAFALPFEERSGRFRAAAPVKTQQDVSGLVGAPFMY